MSNSQTNVFGEQGDSTWTKAKSPYVITGNISVSSGKTLTIQPGVIINLYGATHTQLTVQGTLKAIGTVSDSIRFIGLGGCCTPTGPIYFDAASSNSQLKYVQVNGLSANGAIYILSSSTTVDHCTIQNSGTYGILVSNNALPNITNNAFINNKNLDVFLGLDNLSRFKGNNAPLRLGLTAQTMTKDTTLTPDNYYYLTDNITIPTGRTLTIQPGVIINLYGATHTQLTVQGTLKAIGTVSDSIRFIGLGGCCTPTGPIYFDAASSNSQLKYVQVNGLSANGAIYILSSSTTVDHCTIQNSGTYGILVSNNALPNITNNAFINNKNLDVFLGLDNLSRFKGNNAPLRLGLTAQTMTKDTTLTPDNYYYLTDNITIPTGRTLTIQPGVIINLYGATRTQLTVQGTLKAIGTVSDSIRFIGLGGCCTPTGPIYFDAASSNSQLKYVQVNGLSANGAIYILSSSTTVDHCTIQNSGTYGILVSNNALPNITNNAFINNKNLDVFLGLDNLSRFKGNNAPLRLGLTAQTMTKDTTLTPDNYYYLTDNITIPTGRTLTIQPGVIINLYGATHTQLTVQGTLKAIGTVSDSIRFIGLGGCCTPTGPIYFDAASSNSQLKYVQVNGLSANGAIYILSSSTTVDHCTIQNSGTYGILVSNNALPNITNNAFINNKNLDVFLGLDNLSRFKGNNAPLRLGLTAQTMTKDTTLTPDNYYYLTDNITIPTGRTLTIQPGVIINLYGATHTQLTVQGTLKAIGTVSDSIRFIGLGGCCTPTGPIYFDAASSNSQLKYVQVNGLSANGAIYILSSSTTVDHCTIQNSGTYGILVSNNALPNITNNAFINNKNLDVFLGLDNLSRFKGNNAPLRLGLTAQTMTKDTTLTPDNYYYLTDNITIPTGRTLTIQPGVIINLYGATRTQLTVQGTLKAIGTVSDSIRFIGLGGCCTPTGPIYFDAASSNSQLKYVQVNGLSANGAIYILSSSTTVDHCTIQNSGTYGILVSNNANALLTASRFSGNKVGVLSNSGNSIIKECNFSGNSSLAVDNVSSNLLDTIDARYCWWGSASGPRHSSNPFGTGDAISDRVKYIPFKTADTTEINVSGNKALKFDGINDYVALNSLAVNNLSQGTIETWVYLEDLAREPIVSKQYNNVNSYSVFSIGSYSDNNGSYQQGQPGVIYFHPRNGVNNLLSKTSLQTGRWYHLAISFSTSGATVYINGKADGFSSDNFSIPNDISGSIVTRLGSWNGGANSPGFLHGELDEFRIWNIARSQEQVASDMCADYPPGTPNLILHYKMDESDTSSLIIDSGLSGLNGILGESTAKPVFIQSTILCPDSTSPADSCSKTALYFNGSNQFIKSLASITKNYTIETWVKASNISTNQNIIVGTLKSYNPQYAYSDEILIRNGKFVHYLSDKPYTGKSVVGTTIIDTSKWYHIAITATAGGLMRLYVNGSEEGTPVSIGTPEADDEFIFSGNVASNLAGFNGKIDEVRIWDVALTQTEIQKWMNRTVSSAHPEYTHLKHYYRIEEGHGNIIQDLTGGIIGTLVNMDTATAWVESNSPLSCNSGNFRLNQKITFDPIPTKSFGDSAFVLHASASSGLPVSFKVVSGSASIAKDSVLTINGGGNITVMATQNGDSVYNSATPVQQTLVVIQALQQVTFNAYHDTTSTTARYLLVATASSGLPVSYSIVTGFGILKGDTLSFNGSGIVTVRASQPGNQNYASDYAEKTFCIAPNQPGEITGFTQTCKGTQTYSVPALPGVTFTWSISGGGTLNTTNGTSVNVNWTSLGAYTLTVTSSTPCDSVDVPYRSISVQVINSTISGAVTNMYPPTGTVINSFPFSLSWKPGDHSDLYDVYIWESDETPSVTPAAINLRQIGYVVYPQVLPHYGPGKTYNWQIVSNNGCSQTASAIQNFTVGNLPDLTVSNVYVANSVYSGDSIDINVQIWNVGKMATVVPWQDVFYLSRDSVFDDPRVYPGVDTYLGAKPNVSDLGIGSSYTSSIRIALPEKIIDSNYIIVKTNAFNAQSESDYGNNTGFKAFKILLTTPPDLVVKSLETPTSFFSGQKINVSYTVINNGAETFRDSVWEDAIYISPNQTFVASESIKLAELSHYGKLNSGASYFVEDSVSVPQYIFGSYYIHVFTDATDVVYEVTGENNNVTTSDPITIFLTPPPDFVVTQVQTDPVATAGTPIQLNYTVQNIGASKPAQYGTQWTDYYFISHDSVFNSRAQIIGYLNLAPGPVMNAGDIYSKTANLTIPANFTGSGYIFVYTDYLNNIYEYHSENNNIDKTSISVNNPDLVTSIISVAGSALAGSSIDVTWKVQNTGNGKSVAINRADIIWMSASPVFDRSASYQLGGVYYNSSLDTGSSLIKETSVNIPDTVSGTRYLFVQTDAYNNITESNENNNTSTSKPIVISSGPQTYVDLHPDTVFVNPVKIKAEDSYSITYTVSNIGLSNITGKNWVDNIYRSHDPVFNNNAVLISANPENRSLPANSSYQEIIPFSSTLADLNNKDTAYWYYYVVTDANNNLYEHNGENNNTQKSDLLTITHDAFPDLNVTGASGSAFVASGKLTTVTWTVRNDGGTTGFNNEWYDAVFFSKDSTLSGDDFLAGTRTVYGPVDSKSSYTQKLNVSVPNGISGSYYMLLVSDYTQVNRDVNRSNNIRTVATNVGSAGGGDTITVHISLSASADLTVKSFTSPSVGSSGQPATAKWSVSNIGDTVTTSPYWKEYIYLSTDDNIDASDVLLGTYIRTQPLQKGASYSDSLLVFLPANKTGNYYLLFKTDGGNNIYEYGGENNNTASSFIFITQPAPCDLTVSNISMPAQAQIGDTVLVKWQVNNIGQNPAAGYVRQGVYLSKDSVWDVNDILVSDNLYQMNISPAGDSVYTEKVKIAGVYPNNNYIIVRTDLLNNIPEQDETNNTASSAKTINVTVPNLPINILTHAVLKNYRELYYKILIPDSLVGGTLHIILNGDSANALNELYIKLDSIPTRINHDFMYNNPVSGSQDIVIPTLSKGTYYLMAYGSTSQLTALQNITLLATPINFTILNVTANQGGNTGMVTVKITGAKFDPTVTVTIKNSILGTYTATKIQYINSTSLYATFDLNGATLGTYDLVLTKKGLQATLSNGFNIVPGTGGGTTGGTSGKGYFCNIINAGDDALLHIDVNHPDRYKPIIAFPMYVIFGNSGNVDIPIPQIILQSLNGSGIGDTPEGAIAGKLFDLLLKLIEDSGPNDVLRPGVTLQKTFYSVLPLGAPHSQFEYRLLQK